MNKVRIEKVSRSEVPALIELIDEFAKHSDLEQYFEITEESLQNVMFGEDSFVCALLALDGEKPAGYALFYPGFLSFRGQPSIYLEDIYVRESHRGLGLGKRLLTEVARNGAADFGAVRMDFQVLRTNANAIAFYKNLGAIVDEGERHFKFVDEEFLNLLS